MNRVRERHWYTTNMNRCVKMLLVVATSCLVLSAAAYTKDTTLECPDDQALQLLELAVSARDPKHGFKDSIGAFSYVIKNANRPMDEVALRAACRGLAHDSYITEHYGPTAAADVFGLIPPKEADCNLR